MGLLSTLASPIVPASGATSGAGEAFASSTAWKTSLGTAKLSDVRPSPDGNGALEVHYTVGPNVEIGYADTTAPADFGSAPLTGVRVSYQGDGTYNTLYVKLEDAAGEHFYYRVGNLDSTGWRTTDVTFSGGQVSGDEADGVLDGRIDLYRLVVARNGTQPTSGTVTVDAVTPIRSGWSQPTSANRTFDPNASESNDFSITASGAGDYSLVLTDPEGKSRTLTDTVTSAGTRTVVWDGRADDRTVMAGLVDAVFRHDSTPDGRLGSDAVASGLRAIVDVSITDARSVQLLSFDDDAEAWAATTGSISPARTTDAVQGAAALRMTYDLSSVSTAELGRSRSGADASPDSYATLTLAYRGDGSLNTLNLRLRDSTGKEAQYRVGDLRSRVWRTAVIDLSQPVSIEDGDASAVLSGPISFHRLGITRSSGQPATGAVLVDDLRLRAQGWGHLSATGSVNRQTGGTLQLGFNSSVVGDYALTLSDSAGHVRTLTGTARSGETIVPWDGRADDGTYLAGVVSGSLRIDDRQDGKVAPDVVPMTVPYLTAVTARDGTDTPSSVIGVNSFMTTATTLKQADDDAAAMERLHVATTREEFNWALIEPKQKSFDWVKTDRAVAVAEGRGVSVVGKLFYTAPWASSAPQGTPASSARYYPPKDMSAFAAFATAAAERYRGKVHNWEIWNEPDLDRYWLPAASPSQYAAMLQATSAAIKRVDPSARVLIGGLSGFDQAYLDAVTSAGALGSFDDLAIHTYVEGGPESAVMGSWLGGARAWIERTKPTAKLWVTEAGWSTCGCTSGVTPALQAEYLPRLYLTALAYGVQGVQWFSLRDHGNTASRDDNYGLITTAGALKPAYESMRQVGAALDSMSYVGSAAPTNGDETVVDDLAVTTGVQTYAPSGASLTAKATTTRLGGVGGLSVNYSLPIGSAAEIRVNDPVAGSPGALSLWAYGDASANALSLRLQDAEGELIQAKVGQLSSRAWSRHTFYLDGGNPNLTFSGGNGKVDYPVRVRAIQIARPLGGQGYGQIFVDDLTAHYGKVTRGATLVGRNFNEQALYSLLPSSAPTAATVARQPSYLQTGDDYSTLPSASDQSVNVALTSRPKYVVNTVDAVFDATRNSARLRWVSGDRSRVTIQIVNAAGKVVRTLATNQAYTSGAHILDWDLKNSSAARVAPGSYAFKITADAVTGQPFWVGRSFLVR
ncbi:FlgD immunoglobulin-like domain containing protein [Curtobacterium sp. MWU13-2055]|uniref:FlgD immunoglobulin-like domain containing protein n=1 Tax=Curtobacterium sp. MWU13-2055 TaxID=2931928 RepID=UPI00200EDDE9|nr:FlgD immunoglobulin-like domain containing protein [Curtobacterium sp. MWU13-2055]